MANVVEIIIRGKDSTGGFSSPIKNLADLEKAANSMAKAVIASTMAAAGAIAALTVKAIDHAEEMKKMAEIAQVPVQAFSKMAHAANLAETDLDTFSHGLKFLNVAMADAAAGGKFKDVFKSMGLSVIDANGKIKATGDVLLEVADKFAGYEQGAGKASLAIEIFGHKHGEEMIPLLNKGSAELRQGMDEIAGVTADTAEKADEFNDNIIRLKAILGELGLAIAGQILPALKSLSEWMIKTAKDGDTFGITARGLAEIVKFLAYSAYGLYQILQMIGTVIGSVLAIAFESASAQVKTITELFGIWYTGTKKNLESIWTLIKLMGELGSVVGFLSEGDFSGAWDAATGAVTKFQTEVKNIIGNTADVFAKSKDVIVKNYSDAFSNAKAIALKAIDDIQARTFKMADFFSMIYSAANIQGAALGGGPKIAKVSAPTMGKAAKGDEEEAYFNSKAYGEAMQKILDKRAEMHEKLAEMMAEMSLKTMEPYQAEIQAAWNEYNEKTKAIDALAQDEEEYRLAKELAEEALNARLREIEKRKQQQDQQTRQKQLQATGEMFGNLATTANAFGKKGFAAAKALASAQALVNTYSSAVAAYNAMAGIPFVGPALAVAAAAAAVAAGLANVASINAQKYTGQAHGGLDYVPSESTYLLQRGERVLAPNQNAELMAYMADANNGGIGRMVEVVINLDGSALAKGIGEMSRDGRLLINARAIA